jgi:hypothetical protein
MRRSILALVFALVFLAAATTQTARPFGTIDYVEGSVTITRAGKVLGEANFGDDLFPNDLVRTSNDGMAIIKLDRSTGMTGDLTIKARTTIYLRLQADATSPRTTIEVISGQIGSKLARISGTPTLNVATETTVMGVRGTEFGFVSSPTGNVLVYCTESSVSVSDGTTTVVVPAGKAAERKAGERLKLLPVAVSNAQDFENRWISADIEAFKGNAVAALGDFARRYDQLLAEFNRLFEPFQKSETLTKWMREDAAGTTPSGNTPAVLREKREMISLMTPLRRNLFIFERIYYRVEELAGIILGTSLERSQIRPGLTAGEFLRKVRSDAPLLNRRVTLYRYGEVLYAIRNEGKLPINFGDDDFFDSSSGF